ncbi:hypothetical protein LLG96_02025 [bacterium]|nr:hypothetical protein [bacterium]
MKTSIRTAGYCSLLLLLSTGMAYAGVMGRISGWMTGEAVMLALSTVLTIAAGLLGLTFRRISRTLREAGEFLASLGTAIEDKRLTREELASILKEGREVFEVWR